MCCLDVGCQGLNPRACSRSPEAVAGSGSLSTMLRYELSAQPRSDAVLLNSIVSHILRNGQIGRAHV